MILRIVLALMEVLPKPGHGVNQEVSPDDGRAASVEEVLTCAGVAVVADSSRSFIVPVAVSGCKTASGVPPRRSSHDHRQRLGERTKQDGNGVSVDCDRHDQERHYQGQGHVEADRRPAKPSPCRHATITGKPQRPEKQLPRREAKPTLLGTLDHAEQSAACPTCRPPAPRRPIAAAPQSRHPVHETRHAGLTAVAPEGRGICCLRRRRSPPTAGLPAAAKLARSATLRPILSRFRRRASYAGYRPSRRHLSSRARSR